MTHEYVIALGGVILPPGPPVDPPPTAIGWAADRVLAVGTDEVVRAISRGDSTFLRLDGCAVTQAPSDVERAQTLIRLAVASGRPFSVVAVLALAGLVDPEAGLEPGSRADLAFWSADPPSLEAGAAASLRIVAIVRDGGFIDGDIHHGPFAQVDVA